MVFTFPHHRKKSISVNQNIKHKKNWPVAQLLGLWVDCVTPQTLLDAFAQVIHNRESWHVVTMNAEMAYSAQQDPELKSIIAQADVVVPDGIGVVWGLQHQGVKTSRLPGIELADGLLKQAATLQHKVYLLGSSQDTLDILTAKLAQELPDLCLVGCRNGYFNDAEETQIVADIQQACPDILLVAMGVPRQEQWIARYREQIKVPVMMGVGGSLDVMAGKLQRAPLWMRQAHLEWMYRLIQQPSRWQRMLSLPKFVLQVLRHHD